MYYDENNKIKGEPVFLRFELVAGDNEHIAVKNL